MKIAVCIDHDQALAAYRDAGGEYPTIPPGKNTVWECFRLESGEHAIIINQTGFAPNVNDNEEMVNGCSLAVACDAPDEQTGRKALEDWIEEFLKE